MPIEILMPALSPTMEEGTLSKWNVKEGDTVSSGDVIAEIETDKAAMEVEAVDEGVIGKILIEEGAEGVKVNTLIALLLAEGEGQSAVQSHIAGEVAPAATSGSAAASTSDIIPVAGLPPAPASGEHRIKASPLARRLARDAGLELGAVAGSGPQGRIIKRDVQAAMAQPTPVSSASAAHATAPVAIPSPMDEVEPLAKYGVSLDRYALVTADNITKISADRLSESFRDIPHFPLNMDCRVDALLQFRKEINAKAPEGVKVSVNDILIKASGLALKKVPQANASWIGDGRIALHKHADISVAVAIEGGLITPIVRDADQKGLVEISVEMKTLAARARERKLKPEEFQGGTFSLSNLGMFGVRSFASIINPPQGMILSVGAGEERPAVIDGALAKAMMMTVTLTCDHRVVDGAKGARWLAAFKGFLEDPMTMLM